jgi:hypothetical protein
MTLNAFLHRYTLTAWENSVDPYQKAHNVPSNQDLHCSLSHFFLVISDQDVISADPDQMARLCLLIWIHTGCIIMH